MAKLIDPKDAREVRSFVGHTGAINAVAVSADGATLVTASDDRTVRTWRVSDGALLTTFVARDYQLVSVAISPDGTRIAAGAFDGELFLWNRDGSLVAAATVPLDAGTNRLDGGPHLLPVQGVVFAAAGTRIFTTGAQGLRIFSAADLAPIANPRSFVVMGALAVSPDGDHVAAGDTQYAISLWRASDGTLERQIPAGGPIALLRYAPDGARVYAVVSGAKVNAFPVDGSPSTPIIEPIGGSPTVVAVAPNGHELFVASPWTTFLVDDAGNSLRAEIQEGPFAQSIAFSPDGARLLIGGDFGLVTRSVPGGEVANAIDWGQTSPRYSAVAFSPDGTLVATGDNDGALELWSTATWTKTKDVDKATIRVNSVAFSPDGKLLASVGDDSFEEVYRVPSAAAARRRSRSRMTEPSSPRAASPSCAPPTGARSLASPIRCRPPPSSPSFPTAARSRARAAITSACGRRTAPRRDATFSRSRIFAAARSTSRPTAPSSPRAATTAQ